MKFRVGDAVTWNGHGGGFVNRHYGVVAHVVPPNRRPSHMDGVLMREMPENQYGLRRHESYLVKEDRHARLRWPVVSRLRFASSEPTVTTRTAPPESKFVFGEKVYVRTSGASGVIRQYIRPGQPIGETVSMSNGNVHPRGTTKDSSVGVNSYLVRFEGLFPYYWHREDELESEVEHAIRVGNAQPTNALDHIFADIRAQLSKDTARTSMARMYALRILATDDSIAMVSGANNSCDVPKFAVINYRDATGVDEALKRNIRRVLSPRGLL